jgi:hypothetical protein
MHNFFSKEVTQYPALLLHIIIKIKLHKVKIHPLGEISANLFTLDTANCGVGANFLPNPLFKNWPQMQGRRATAQALSCSAGRNAALGVASPSTSPSSTPTSWGPPAGCRSSAAPSWTCSSTSPAMSLLVSPFLWVSDPLCLSSSSALLYSDYSLRVHPPANRDDRHLLAHAMASDFSSYW